MNVFITGISSGIGWGLAQGYLARGWNVFGVSRRAPPERNARLQWQALDLANAAEIPLAARRLLGGLENLDLVVLNAGILGRIADLRGTPLTDIQRVMNVNVWANKILLDQLLDPRMPIRQVAAISSGAAINAKRGWNAYSISKAALNMLIALYAAECPETHFCALAPGIVHTPMQDQISALPPDPRFESLEPLREARGTPLMPAPDQVSNRLIAGIANAVKFPSGSFLDLNAIMDRQVLQRGQTPDRRG